MKSILTQHSIERIEERLSMPLQNVQRLLKNGFAVHLGVSSRYSGRIYRLFYSEQDENFFIAVQQKNDGAIITILPAKTKLPITHKQPRTKPIVTQQARREARKLYFDSKQIKTVAQSVLEKSLPVINQLGVSPNWGKDSRNRIKFRSRYKIKKTSKPFVFEVYYQKEIPSLNNFDKVLVDPLFIRDFIYSFQTVSKIAGISLKNVYQFKVWIGNEPEEILLDPVKTGYLKELVRLWGKIKS